MNGLLAIELAPELVEETPLYFVWGSNSNMRNFCEFVGRCARLRDATQDRLQESGGNCQISAGA